MIHIKDKIWAEILEITKRMLPTNDTLILIRKYLAMFSTKLSTLSNLNKSVILDEGC